MTRVSTLALVLLASSCGSEAPPSAPSDSPPGPPAVVYAARKLGSQETFSLEDVRGQPVLLATWATWCGACREELPHLEQLWQSYRDQGLIVVSVNINVGGTDDPLIAFAQKKGLTYLMVHDEDNRFQATFGTTATPESVLIDRRGAVAEHWVGALDTMSPEVTGAVESALAEMP